MSLNLIEFRVLRKAQDNLFRVGFGGIEKSDFDRPCVKSNPLPYIKVSDVAGKRVDQDTVKLDAA